MNFEYRSEFSYWRNYIPVAFGLFLGFFVFSHYGANPFANIGFLIVVALVLFDVAVAGFLRFRAPRSFQVEGAFLRVRWRRRKATFPIESIAVRKGLRWLFNSATVLQTDGGSFVVFNDLDGFGDFISIFDASVTSQTLPTHLD